MFAPPRTPMPVMPKPMGGMPYKQAPVMNPVLAKKKKRPMPMARQPYNALAGQF